MLFFKRKRFGWISSHFSRVSLFLLALEFLLLYLVIGTVFAFAYWNCCKWLPESIFTFNKGDLCLPQAFYFSFITQLTIGYGDYVPMCYAQILAVAQGIFGVLFIGIWAGVVLAKWFTAGRKDSLLFADWAGYSLREEKFFVMFVNRRADDLVDVNINSIVKLARYNPVPPSVNAPYIGKSAWTFSLQKIPVDVIAELCLSPARDGVKISISGTAGMTRCTNWRKYGLDEIWVLPDRDFYWDDKFENPRFNREFFEEFERPHVEGAIPFINFDFAAEAQRRRKQ